MPSTLPYTAADSTSRHSRLSSAASVSRRALGRLSYGSFTKSQAGAQSGEMEKRRPSIPNVLSQDDESKSTPLPALSITVLSITMLGEFLSACVSTPYMLFMVESFGVSDVSFWTGILVASFFLTQFLTSLLWQIVADKYGRRTVLIASLFGGSVFCSAFGASRTLFQALCLRAMQGVFAGAIGVARGSVSSFTDATNEGRAYAILGFCWGFGGVSGSMIGGTFESPVTKWPGIFENVGLFSTLPYLLPCLIAGSIMLLGAILACFLGADGGPHTRTEEETKDAVLSEEGNLQTIHEDENTSLLPKPSQAIQIPAHQRTITASVYDAQSPRLQSFGVPLDRTYTATSARSRYGSFGVPMNRTYTMGSSSSGFRPRLAREATTAGAAAVITARRRSSIASNMSGHGARSFQRPRPSMVGGEYDMMLAQSVASNTSDLGFARRLVLANENAVNHIADLWVAAAMFVDQGDTYDYFDVNPDEYWGSDEDDDEYGDVDEDAMNETEFTYQSRPSHLQTQGNGILPFRAPSSPAASPRTRVTILPSQRKSSFGLGVNTNTLDTPRQGRLSTNYSGFGTATPAAPGSPLLSRSEVDLPGTEREGLAPIMESVATLVQNQELNVPMEEGKSAEKMSLTSQIPVLIIIQYGLLALHATTHDQVFMSYLVSNYDAGGLNLNAGNFAQLIALMSLAQIFYQFYLYPHLGPPRGPFGYLTMFRISSGMFVLGYLAMIPLRKLASPDGNGTGPLMAALASNMALRYCAGTFGYTSISILLNYMTPPHAVGYANGIAQSVVSLARCVGPILGGFLWSSSVEGNPEGYPFGFIMCAGMCLLAALHCTFIQ